MQSFPPRQNKGRLTFSSSCLVALQVQYGGNNSLSTLYRYSVTASFAREIFLWTQTVVGSVLGNFLLVEMQSFTPLQTEEARFQQQCS
jgi:hypothetical protein